MSTVEFSRGPESLQDLSPEQKILESEDVVLIAGKGNVDLSEKIAFQFGKQLHQPITVFADGEKKHAKPEESLGGKHVFLLQSMQPSPDERTMEFFIMLDAAIRAKAERITAVFPYLAYMRQDKKDGSRVPISATLIPNISQFLGLDGILTMELHSDAQQGFFRGPWDTIPSNYVTVPYIQSLNLASPVVAAADAGGRARAQLFSRQLGLGSDIVQGDKSRDIRQRNVSRTHGFNGEVEGRDIIIVEDMIDTAGSIAGNHVKNKPGFAHMLHDAGANSIIAIAAYPILSPDGDGISAIDKIIHSPITQVVTTNAIELKPDARDAINTGRLKVLDISTMLAEGMYRIHVGKSISDKLFLPEMDEGTA